MQTQAAPNNQPLHQTHTSYFVIGLIVIFVTYTTTLLTLRSLFF